MPYQRRYELDAETCRRILEWPTNGIFHEIRTNAIAAVVYGVGAHSGEVHHLRWKDIGSTLAGATMTLRLVNRRHAERTVPVPAGSQRIFQFYLDVACSKGVRPEPDAFLFSSLQDRPLTVTRTDQILSARGQALGLPIPLTALLLRRSCARHLVDAGMQMDAVAHLMGLSSPASVEELIGP